MDIRPEARPDARLESSRVRTLHRSSNEGPEATAQLAAARREAEELREEVERRRASEARLEREVAVLRKANAEFEEFASIAAHDLKEPLAIAACYVRRLVRLGADLGEEGTEAVHGALDALERMNQMAHGLLTFTRAGTILRESERVDTELIVDQVVTNLRLSIETGGAKVVRRALPPVAGDPLQIFQVFQNLVSNALKFRGEADPCIEITAEPGGALHTFTVRDNGVGIPPEDQARVFGIFERLERDRLRPGTGLGLAICRRIVERHGGRIWVESAAGAGATFRFTLRRAGARDRVLPASLGEPLLARPHAS